VCGHALNATREAGKEGSPRNDGRSRGTLLVDRQVQCRYACLARAVRYQRSAIARRQSHAAERLADSGLPYALRVDQTNLDIASRRIEARIRSFSGRGRKEG
jgi:hypothetical protein